jgi:uncharacterized membrane protein
MSVIEKSIEVDVPVRVAYDQWTQFEDFPRFMEGVEEVEQIDDVRLRWHVSIAGVDREFEARIEEQEPDRRITWRAVDEDQAGTVTFESVEDRRTRVRLEMDYDSERWTDKVADFLNIVDRRAEGDLERFKEFIEERGGTTGAWRGEVRHGDVQQPDPSTSSTPSTQSGPSVPPPTGGAGEPEVGGGGHPGGGTTGQPPRRA